MIRFVKRWLERRHQRAEQRRKWNADYARLSPEQKASVRNLLQAQIDAANIMRSGL